MITKRGLGRGLGALLSSEPTEAEALVDVPIDQVEVNPNQPRKVFDFTALDELAASIKASGVIQPIIVRRVGGGYQLIAGERRWRAARQAGLDRIPAIVREATDAQSLELALVENLLREDLNPIEAAQAYQKLLAEFAWTQEALAEARGVAAGKGRRRSVELAALEEALQRGLMTRVRIIGNERKGKIEVSYATADELERLSDLLGARH